ncbi:protein phosphatase regulator [Saxophila tyrrhenica]|uniref:Protein phosphatase regulator n=1 Tax=Saxophila tyrrhenica TaxID=1690608 RepID=A0AAV9P5A5_9PEZI|nr:protein phosphatase regulator [Saxophila tyrrhenica]
MTRPNIVRADTIDLQDQDNPTAAEHQKPVIHGGLGAHQRAEVHHVLEERNSEEHALADAWNMSGDITEEPGTIDHSQNQHLEQDSATNGMQRDGEDDGENGETEGDADDDMMDRISSSPSIDDGGFTSPSSLTPVRHNPAIERVKWPPRTSSLSPSPRDTPTSTRERTSNQSAHSPPDSSPLQQTPQHLPLHVRRIGRVPSPLVSQPDLSPSPSLDDEVHLPARPVPFKRTQRSSSASKYRHSKGRYEEPLDHLAGSPIMQSAAAMHGSGTDPEVRKVQFATGPEEQDPDMNSYDDQNSERSVIVHSIEAESRPIESPFRKNPFTSNLADTTRPGLPDPSSFNSLASLDMDDVLLPNDDPLLDTPPSPTDSADSWESSEADSLDEDENDDDTDALFDPLDDRFIDSGWGGECLRDTEDIDFEFVYALHTFVATVEGQANAQKGDTMVLLDDSNSYWWLVRVVKDNSIGYLPAEHIETPTERLARLNKHRNIDLSATMLSDNSEKTRNPLKKAMRRRNAKTVQFAAPTYVEASDYDYSSDEEDQPPIDPYAGVVQSEDTQQEEHVEEEPAAEKVTTPEEGGLSRASSSSSRASFDREQAATAAAALNGNVDEPQLSPKLVDKTEAAPLKSRRTRNTDSFLKDDTIETRKITLTPGLLREEGKNSLSTDSTRNPSLENLVKTVSPTESLSKKDSKKEKKEKKGGMLSGLFKSKKKDKKSKEDMSVADLSDAEKASYEAQSPTHSPVQSGRVSPEKDNAGSLAPSDIRRQEVQTRQPTRGKLQKAPPHSQTSIPAREAPPQEPPQQQAPEEPKEMVAELQGSEVAYEMGAAEPEQAATDDQPHLHTELALQDKQTKEGALSPLTNVLGPDTSKSQKPVKAKKVKQRMELDDFDTPTDDEGPNPFKEQDKRATGTQEDGLSESPVEITHSTFMHGTESIHIPMPGANDPRDLPDDEDDKEVEVEDEEEPDSLTSSPSIVSAPNNQPKDAPTTTLAPTRGLSTDSLPSATSSADPISPASQQPWSDASLRAWLEDGSEVRDMLVLIYDTSGVTAVGREHPVMKGLFERERKGVEGMLGELDGLLAGFLGRRGIQLN